jgi:acetyl-CoA C-acetyltransferase
MNHIGPRAPVLVGVGTVTQRAPDTQAARDAVDLMTDAVQAAIEDAGARSLASRAGSIAVPRGTWGCDDPGRVIAERIGSSAARTILAEVGVLQQTLVTRACAAIAGGEVDVAIVCGGEAKYRALLAAKTGDQAPEHPGTEAPPDEVLRPDGVIVTQAELERGLGVPVRQYAIVESALAHAAGHSPDEHRAHLGALWSSFARVAAANTEAWDRTAPSADAIVTPSDRNRLVAVPYTRLLCSQWNVDQAAALLFASADAAREAGVDPERCVYPLSAAESNAMVPLSLRRDMHRWPAFAAAAERAFALAGRSRGDVDLVELYSCFPAAVQVQANELGIGTDRPLTVTGGMTFAGGPLNNYALQSTAAMARLLREGAGETGIVTCVSGMLTKPAVALWSAAAPATGFAWADVSAEARTPTVPFTDTDSGDATIAGATVVHRTGGAERAIAVLDVSGARTIAVCEDADAIAWLESDGAVGRSAVVVERGRFAIA